MTFKTVSSKSNKDPFLHFTNKYKKEGRTIIKAPGYNESKNLSEDI